VIIVIKITKLISSCFRFQVQWMVLSTMMSSLYNRSSYSSEIICIVMYVSVCPTDEFMISYVTLCI